MAPTCCKTFIGIQACKSNHLVLIPNLSATQDQRDIIARTLRGDDVKSNDAKRTIFQEILDSKLPLEEKSQQRLVDEAQIVIGGGVETTAFALSIAAFHIINKPHIYERLHADLVKAFPNRTTLELQPLEQMPYLKACIMVRNCLPPCIEYTSMLTPTRKPSDSATA